MTRCRCSLPTASLLPAYKSTPSLTDTSIFSFPFSFQHKPLRRVDSSLCCFCLSAAWWSNRNPSPNTPLATLMTFGLPIQWSLCASLPRLLSVLRSWFSLLSWWPQFPPLLESYSPSFVTDICETPMSKGHMRASLILWGLAYKNGSLHYLYPALNTLHGPSCCTFLALSHSSTLDAKLLVKSSKLWWVHAQALCPCVFCCLTQSCHSCSLPTNVPHMPVVCVRWLLFTHRTPWTSAQSLVTVMFVCLPSCSPHTPQWSHLLHSHFQTLSTSYSISHD